MSTQKVRASSVKSAFTKAGLNRSVEQAREIEEKWRLEEEERERAEGDDARDARRGVEEVIHDMDAYLASIVSSLSPSSSVLPP